MELCEGRKHGLRTELAKLGAEAMMKKIPAWLIVNNRVEGSAPHTIFGTYKILLAMVTAGR